MHKWNLPWKKKFCLIKQCGTSHWILQKKESFYLTELNGINHWTPKKKKSFCPNQQIGINHLVLQKNKIFRLAEQFGINHWILHKNKREQHGWTLSTLHKNEKEQNSISHWILKKKKNFYLAEQNGVKHWILQEKISLLFNCDSAIIGQKYLCSEGILSSTEKSSEKNRTKSTYTISCVINNFFPVFSFSLFSFFLKAHTLAIKCSIFKLQTLKFKICRRLAFGRHRVELKTRSWRRRKLLIRRFERTHDIIDESVQIVCFVI